MDNDNTAKIICFAVGCIIAVYVLFSLLPYLVIFLAVVGAWHLYQEHSRNDRNKRDRR